MKFPVFLFTLPFCSALSFAQTYTQDLDQLFAEDTSSGDRFGWSVDCAGDWLIAGAPFREGATDNEGAAYVFKNNSPLWAEDTQLLPLELEDGDRFGQSVALSLVPVVITGGEFGETRVLEPLAAVGAPRDDDRDGNAGAVYIYRREISGEWTQMQKLGPPEVDTNLRMGTYLEMNRDWLVAGGDEEVYVFAWNETAEIFEYHSTIDPNDDILSLDFDGNRIAVGIRDEVLTYTDAGFGWLLDGSVTGTGSGFGASVAVYGNLLAVGAPTTQDEGVAKGAVHLYRWEENGWVFEDRVDSFDESYIRFFGSAIALHRNELYSGCGDALTDRAFRFVRGASGTWTRTHAYAMSDSTLGGNLGNAIAVTADHLLIAASGDDDKAGVLTSNSGVVSVYGRPFVALKTLNIKHSVGGTFTTFPATEGGAATGERVILTAQTNPGYDFDEWSGDFSSDGGRELIFDVQGDGISLYGLFLLPLVNDPPTTDYLDYIFAFFPDEGFLVTEELADPDGDGLTNREEFVFVNVGTEEASSQSSTSSKSFSSSSSSATIENLDPRVFTETPWSYSIVLEGGEPYIEITVHHRLPEAFGMPWAVLAEASSDLSFWSSANVAELPPVPIGDNVQRATFRLPLSAEENFLRLRVTFDPGFE